MNDCLKKIFERIVRNDIIREIIKRNHTVHVPVEKLPDNVNKRLFKNLPINKALEKYNAYKSFVDYQRCVYCKNRTSLSEQGFQGGVPWVGDLENASVLFLSSNPAFTWNQCTPRYNAKSNNWTITYKNNEKVESEVIDELDKVINFYKKPFGPGNLINLMEIINDNKKGSLLTVNIREDERIIPKKGGVKFWNDLTEKVLIKLYENDDDKELVKNWKKLIEEKAVFTEIVPFQSLGEEHIDSKILQLCWDSFSSKILSYSKANLWIVVGSQARNQLSQKMKNDGNFVPADNGQMPDLETGKIYSLMYKDKYEKRPLTLWVIPHPNARPDAQNKFRSFNDFVEKITGDVWTELIASLKCN